MEPAPVAAAPEPSLKRSATLGILWSAGQALLSRGFNVAVFVLLARLLAPQAFGLVATATVFVALLQVFIYAGFGQALVQRESLDDADLDTVFWTSVGFGVLFTAVLFGCAPLLAAAYAQPGLTALLRGLSFACLLVSLGGVHGALLQRRLQFRSLATRTLGANLVAGAVAVTAALVGAGVWSLVLQTLALAGTRTVLVWLATGWRPGRSVALSRLRPIFRVSRNILGVNFLQFLNQRTDDFLIGLFLGPVALGLYTVAYRLLLLMLDVLVGTIQTVAFPTLARLQGDPERLRRAYLSGSRLCCAVAIPAFALVATVAPELTRVFFGSRWHDSARIMTILALFGLLQGPLQLAANALTGVGRPEVVFRIGLANTVTQVVGFAVAVRFGIGWVAVSFVVRAYLLAPLWFLALRRIVGLGVRAQLAAYLTPVACSAVLVAAVLAARHLVVPDQAAGVRLAVLAAVGTAAYVAGLAVVGRPLLRELAGYATTLRTGRSGRARVHGVAGAAAP